MFSQSPDFSISILSQTQFLKMVVELTKHIATLYHFPSTLAAKISLAIDEAVTNVIKHSYNNAGDKNITIEYFLALEGIKIKLIFTGSPPVLVENEINIRKMIKSKRRGGLGVRLMKTIMDSVNYQTIDGINTCEMIKWQKSL